MARQKDNTKIAKQKPESKTEKTNQASDKTPIKTTPVKRSASSSRDKRPTGKNTSTEKKGNEKPSIEKPIVKIGRAKQIPNKFPKKHSDGKHSSLSAKEKTFKEKLESMAKVIDLLKKTSGNSDIVDLEKTFELICKHIFFFLKALPEIKNGDLLIIYSKLYKKLERFMKSATFDFEFIDDIPIDDHVENNILIEKVMENDVIFYRTTYSNENMLVSIFHKDGKPVYHYKIKTDGKQERIPTPNVFGKRLVIEDTFDFEIESEKDNYDGTKYTVLGFAKVNKDSYGSYRGDNFDSIFAEIENRMFWETNISLGKSLDFNAANLMIEKGAEQNILSNIKSKKTPDAKIKIFIFISIKNSGDYEKQTMLTDIPRSKMKANDPANQIKPTVLLKDELALEIPSPKENNPVPIALFAGLSVYKNRNNLLYAEPKVGKTFFSIEIAKNEHIKKPLFVTLDDFSSDLDLRYQANLGDKNYLLMKLDDFDTTYKTELEERKTRADAETIKGMVMPGYRRIKILKRQNYIEMGVIKDKSDTLDKIAVFNKIIAEALDDGHDFICLDCLHSILEGSGRSLNRDKLIGILKPISNMQVTFLLIHHTNKDSETMSLTNQLRYVFDNIYRLEFKERFDEGSSKLELIEENARHNNPHDVTIMRSIRNDSNVTHIVVDSKISQPNSKNGSVKKNIRAKIVDILINEEENSISYDDLINKLKEITGKENDEANIMKHLKNVSDKEKLISMKDGSTWKGGISIARPKS